MSNRRALPVLLSLCAVALACTAEREPRSFVQPNALKKADLQGSWYYLQTVLDAPPASHAAFIGLSTDLWKVRFDIQQDKLYARRAYEFLADSEDARTKEGKTCDSTTNAKCGYLGQPLAAWRIERHFDIIRDYNPTTGEESNRIIESDERPWNQREFIRVDWSNNLINDYAGLFSDGAGVEPVSFWESDPGKPESIHLERAETGNNEFTPGEANYLDVTNKLVLSPEERTLCFSEGGQELCFRYPACYLPYQLAECTASMIKVRHSFAKISPKHQYEPRNWDGHQMEQFGLWDVGLNRFTYNRQYGVTNSGIGRHAARFNIWKQVFDAKGNPVPPQSIAAEKHEVRTIPYYADTSAATFPEDLFDDSKEVIKQWNDAVSVAVKDYTGKPPAEPVFVFCHNPVKLADPGKDPPACKADLKPDLDAAGNVIKDKAGNPILHARQGDPRRSRIFWVNQPQFGGPLGYGPPMYDPETGETLSGQAYIYGAALDTYASRSRDLVLLTLGLIKPDDFIQGANVSDWVSGNRRGITSLPQTLTSEDVSQRTNSMDFSFAEGLAPQVKIDLSSAQAFTKSFRARQDALYETGIYGRGQADMGAVRRARARNTPIEGMMVTPEVITAAVGNPLNAQWDTLTDAEKAQVSPLRVRAFERFSEERMAKLRGLGFDFTEFADEGVAQRAGEIARKLQGSGNIDGEEIWRQLRKDIYVAVTLHEVGHNVGLRHNFRASYDSLNYDPEYWNLRTAPLRPGGATKRYGGVNAATGEIIGVPYAGKGCVAGKLHPRYIDCPGGALSVEEAAGSIREYQYSSVMDYGAEFNSDLKGLGHYDKAAMKFSYAGDGFVEVFTKMKPTADAVLWMTSLQYFSGSYGFPSPIDLGQQKLTGLSYHTYPGIFQNGAADMQERVDVPRARIEALSNNLPLMIDVGVLTDRNNPAISELQPMVPYYFCGDEYAGNLTCQRFDSGADAYEQARDLISRYENYYLLNNFKRDRYAFYTSSAYRGTILGRYLYPLRMQMTWYTLFRSIFGNFSDVDAPDSLFNSEDGWGNFSVAVTEGFDLLGRIITMPEAGAFKMEPAATSASVVPQYRQVSETPMPAMAGMTNVSLIDGKFSSSTWDFNKCGYYWSDECQSRIGYFLDKTFALEVLSDSIANFTGRDTSVDVRLYAIGYVVPFKNQLYEKFGAMLAGDFQSLAPAVGTDGRLKKLSWSLDAGGAGRQNLLDPDVGFTMQLYAGVYGLSGFPATFDQMFVDATRVFVVGNGEAPVPDRDLIVTPGAVGSLATNNPAELIGNGGTKAWFVWTDQSTGKSYAAHSIKPGINKNNQSFRLDVGVRMLDTARTLEQQASVACGAMGAADACKVKARAFQDYRQNIDIMRSLHNAYGYARYNTDAPFYF